MTTTANPVMLSQTLAPMSYKWLKYSIKSAYVSASSATTTGIDPAN